MSHFNLKSLTFYGIAIGSVVILFSVVTAYGKTHLKAPPAISGRYRLNAENLPGCLKAEELVLTVDQSGEYLHGSLSPVDTVEKKAIQKKHPLEGELLDQQLSLVGPVPGITSCNQSVNSAVASERSSSVKIQGRFEGKTLLGQITLSSIPEPAEFTAQQEPLEEKPGNTH